MTIENQVNNLIEKCKTFDHALENADPAIITHHFIPYAELTDQDLEDLYQYKYPQNVEWLKEVRLDFLQRCHPKELS